MFSQRISELHERLSSLLKILENINTMCNNAFGKTASSLAEEEFLRQIPQSNLYRRYKLKYVDTFALLADAIKDDVPFAQLMESYFYIAAEYALMGEPDKMNVFVHKIDWKRWNVTQSQDPAILQIYRELLVRAQELQSIKAH